MQSILLRKLETFGALPSEDREFVQKIGNDKALFDNRADLLQEGHLANSAFLIASGMACRYKDLPNGRRQIIALLIPGDLCGLRACLAGILGHSIGAVSELETIRISRSVCAAMMNRPAVTRALLLSSLADEDIYCESLTNLGQRPAEARLAHIFCELHDRLSAVGLVRNGIFDLPLTQLQLGDMAGLSTVHVNRSLQNLRVQGLVWLRGRRLTIIDLDRLRKLVNFRPT